MHASDGANEENNKPKSRVIMDATAGALAGCVARFVVAPLDVIKIRFQVQLEPIVKNIAGSAPKYTSLSQALVTIFKEEGVQGLWRGTVPGLLLTVPYTAVQFVALEQCKHFARQAGCAVNNPYVSFASGAVAGAAATMASYPFDLLRTTMAAQGEPRVYRHIGEAASGIMASRGFGGLYTGLGTTLLEIIPYAALQFGLYDVFKVSIVHLKSSLPAWQTKNDAGKKSDVQPSLGQLEKFCCGLLSGLLAKMATHPLDVAKKRYQVAGLQRSLKYGARIDSQFTMMSLSHTLTDVYMREGVRGLWKGSVPSIIKAAPQAAITFTVYELAISLLSAAADAKLKG